MGVPYKDPKVEVEDPTKGAAPVVPEGGEGEGAPPAKPAEPEKPKNWIEEASKLYTGKKTKISPDDELGQELWKSVQEQNRRFTEMDKKVKDAEGLKVYQDDLKKIMADPILRAAIVRKYYPDLAKQYPDLVNISEEPPEEEDPRDKAIAGLEERVALSERTTIDNRFENHIKELAPKYPKADIDEIRRFVQATGFIYNDPEAPKNVEKIVAESHERNLRKEQSLRDEIIKSMKRKAAGSEPGGITTPTTPGKRTDRQAFEEAWEAFRET